MSAELASEHISARRFLNGNSGLLCRARRYGLTEYIGLLRLWRGLYGRRNELVYNGRGLRDDGSFFDLLGNGRFSGSRRLGRLFLGLFNGYRRGRGACEDRLEFQALRFGLRGRLGLLFNRLGR